MRQFPERKAESSTSFKKKLRGILASPNSPRKNFFEPTDDELDNLKKIDSSKVDSDEWITIDAESKKNQVFISCGQRSSDEKDIGKKIVDLVEKHTSFKPYFAQYQTSMDGLTQNIFRALAESKAFVAVMHRRDNLDGQNSRYRGSVWIEQEIAIASYLTHITGVFLPSRVYIQDQIIREGVREFILLNPVVFNTPHEVVEDLEKWLPGLDELN